MPCNCLVFDNHDVLPSAYVPWRQWRLRKKNWRLAFGDLVAKIAGDQARSSEQRHPSAKRAATGTVRIHGRGRIVIQRVRGCNANSTESCRDQQAADTKACHSIRSYRSVFRSYYFRSSTWWFSRALMGERNIWIPSLVCMAANHPWTRVGIFLALSAIVIKGRRQLTRHVLSNFPKGFLF